MFSKQVDTGKGNSVSVRKKKRMKKKKTNTNKNETRFQNLVEAFNYDVEHRKNLHEEKKLDDRNKFLRKTTFQKTSSKVKVQRPPPQKIVSKSIQESRFTFPKPSVFFRSLKSSFQLSSFNKVGVFWDGEVSSFQFHVCEFEKVCEQLDSVIDFFFESKILSDQSEVEKYFYGDLNFLNNKARMYGASDWKQLSGDKNLGKIVQNFDYKIRSITLEEGLKVFHDSIGLDIFDFLSKYDKPIAIILSEKRIYEFAIKRWKEVKKNDCFIIYVSSNHESRKVLKTSIDKWIHWNDFIGFHKNEVIVID